jgi:hypothetical protein
MFQDLPLYYMPFFIPFHHLQKKKKNYPITLSLNDGDIKIYIIQQYLLRYTKHSMQEGIYLVELVQGPSNLYNNNKVIDHMPMQEGIYCATNSMTITIK